MNFFSLCEEQMVGFIEGSDEGCSNGIRVLRDGDRFISVIGDVVKVGFFAVWRRRRRSAITVVGFLRNSRVLDVVVVVKSRFLSNICTMRSHNEQNYLNESFGLLEKMRDLEKTGKQKFPTDGATDQNNQNEFVVVLV